MSTPHHQMELYPEIADSTASTSAGEAMGGTTVDYTGYAWTTNTAGYSSGYVQPVLYPPSLPVPILTLTAEQLEAVLAQLQHGWVCAKCNRSYAPLTKECEACNVIARLEQAA